ncbi:MAG: acyl carrier protein [Deltaproteobacteria bacterium]
MATESCRAEIRNFLKTNLAKRPEHLEISDRDDIISNGLIDSLGIIKLIGFLEERFGTTLKDEDIVPENFESVDSISAFLDRTANRQQERNDKA